MKRVLLAVTLLFALFSKGSCQEESRLYHSAWYQEMVALDPEKASKLYDKLIKNYPDSPYRKNILARQADLLRRLNRPEDARAILKILIAEKLSTKAAIDLKNLANSAKDIKSREYTIKEVKRINSLQNGDEPKKSTWKKQQNLRESLVKAHDNLPLLVMREINARPAFTMEAYSLWREMARLQAQVKAMREAGKFEEARRTQKEIDRVRRRMRKVRPHTPLSPGMRRRVLEFLQKGKWNEIHRIFQNQPELLRMHLVRILLSPGQSKRVTPKQREIVFSLLIREIENRADKLKSEGAIKKSKRIRAALNRVKLSIGKRKRNGQLDVSLRELFYSLGWNPGAPPFRPRFLRKGQVNLKKPRKRKI